jgi:hypothetical protein
VIAPVVKPYGWRPAGLLVYLFGPGRHEEHRNPRVVASWDGAPTFHQPPKPAAVQLGGEVLEPGEFDLDLTGLIAVMQEWPRRAKLRLTTPPGIPTADDSATQREVATWSRWLRTAGRRHPPSDAPAWVRWHRYDPKTGRVVLKNGYVWHCPVRLHPDDPTLNDAQWQAIAQRLMEATGIHQAGCRWIAVRHADDHIHLVATLVSEKTGRRVWPRNDFQRLRAECQRLERELSLTPTAGIDKTATRRPSRAELGKAARTGRTEPARVELRRLVTQFAAAASDGGDFLGLLRRDGLLVRLGRGGDGNVRGYAVGLAGDVTAAGEQVYYAGGKLAADLAWPKLLLRWQSASAMPDMTLPRTDDDRVTAAGRCAVLEEATAVVDRATETLRTGHESGDGIAHATGDVLAAMSYVREGRDPGPLAIVLDRYDRCARTPSTVLPARWGPLASDLRMASRRLCAVGSLSGRGQEKFAMAALLLAVAGLIAEIAAWQQARGRAHQAAAARQVVTTIPVDPTLRPAGVGRPTRTDAMIGKPDHIERAGRPHLPDQDGRRSGRTPR